MTMPAQPSADAPTTTTATTSNYVAPNGITSATPFAPVQTGQQFVPQQTTGGYTAEDIARARAQEKEKLYPELERLKEEVRSLTAAQAAVEQEREAARLAAEEAARQAAEAEMTAQQRLEQRQREIEEQLTRERLEREALAATLDRERQYTELVNYREQRKAEMAEHIIPELLDLVDGETADEIESSLARLQEKSAQIIEAATAVAQQQRAATPVSRVTTPPSGGPLDTQSDYNVDLTPEQIRALPMSEYVKHRDKLIGAATQRQNRGLFG